MRKAFLYLGALFLAVGCTSGSRKDSMSQTDRNRSPAATDVDIMGNPTGHLASQPEDSMPSALAVEKHFTKTAEPRTFNIFKDTVNPRGEMFFLPRDTEQLAFRTRSQIMTEHFRLIENDSNSKHYLALKRGLKIAELVAQATRTEFSALLKSNYKFQNFHFLCWIPNEDPLASTYIIRINATIIDDLGKMKNFVTAGHDCKSIDREEYEYLKSNEAQNQ